jgi:hypothetical protein
MDLLEQIGFFPGPRKIFASTESGTTIESARSRRASRERDIVGLIAGGVPAMRRLVRACGAAAMSRRHPAVNDPLKGAIPDTPGML